ncbi:sulfatase family protein [Pontiella sulfatireligans]|uniref:Arylsulfatase n=1 Tax=Pontiella sulfatireligans TaxID=2750658 RepID=A0A6C2UVW8_9BACT|nr:sulfatase [Pontiella sulfatireligans]SPS74588.1 sulfatase S1_N.C [Kiritimatiellales bacterium]VGO23551.1 Arylsulfatase [Pontiella sulfatireligans]
MKPILSIFLGLAVCGSVAAKAADSRPNIIFILTDDQRFDAMGFTGRFPWLETPNLDRIRHEGVHFANAFTTHSLCGPSRAGFLTGMHSHRNGITTNQEGRELDHDKTPTFGQYLQNAGYDTGYIGKWHLGEFDDPRPGWNYWCSFEGQGNYDKNRLNINGTQIVKEGYVTDVLTDYAVDFIEKERSAPFLLYLSHKAVHQPFIPADRHKDLYTGLPAPEPLSWMDNMDDKPEWQRRMVMPPEQGTRLRRKHPIPVPEKRGLGTWPAKIGTHQQRNYLRCIPAVDDGVGRIFQVLEKKGLLDNTVIVFAGDNGYMHGEHGMGDKRQAYNESMRIPLIMRGPGVKPDSTVEEIVLNLDVAPTFLEYAGVKIPDAMQGSSLLPLAEELPVADWRTSFLFTYWRDLITAIPRITAVRSIDKMYAHYPDGDSIDELYNLANDPGEMKNLALLPESAPLKQKMERELKQVMAEADYQAVVARPHPEDLEGRPLGVLVNEEFGPDGLACTGTVVQTIPMNEKLDSHFGCMVFECIVEPESDGIILSHGEQRTGYMFYVQNGVPGFCFSGGNRFHALDGDVSCLNEPTHLLVNMDNHTSEVKFFVNGKLVQTETIYCKLHRWIQQYGDIALGGDPDSQVDPYELSKLGGFTGTIDSFKIQRKRMPDSELSAYAREQAAN